MKIVRIFDHDNLFAIQYDGDDEHIFDKLMDNWSDPIFIDEFLTSNEKDLPRDRSILTLRKRIERDVELIDDKFYNVCEYETGNLDHLFKPLNNNEYRVENMQLQKGRENYFRIYAIRIDENCYVITGGTVKFLHLMKDANYTQEEKTRLDSCKDYLVGQSVVDSDSFYCYLEEE